MASTLIAPRADTQAIEAFLLSQPGVLDASVWLDQGRLNAHVTLPDDSEWDAFGLKRLCAETLGIHRTPVRILLFGARRKAA